MDLPLDPNTNNMFNIGFKNYFGNQFTNQYDNLLSVFDYNADGTLALVSDFNDTNGFNDERLLPDEFLSYMQGIGQDFSWDEHPYFQSLTPYLPDSPDL